MRQAGRCLADYRKLRERYPILTLAKTPELCAEVTVMPVDAFGVDAAVLFADIMIPLEPMGVSLEIQPDVGPIIHDPIRSRAQIDALRSFDPADETAFVMDAIRLVRRSSTGNRPSSASAARRSPWPATSSRADHRATTRSPRPSCTASPRRGTC